MRRIYIKYTKEGKKESELWGFIDDLEELNDAIEFLRSVAKERKIGVIDIYYSSIVDELIETILIA